MNIKKYIKECYELAKEKGFYPEDSKIEDHLMGIVSEIGEAYEAHRGGNIASEKGLAFSIDQILENFNLPIHIDYYIKNFKDCFEQELADVFIRLFNLCGWLGYEDLNCDWGRVDNLTNTSRELLNMIGKTYGLLDEHDLKKVYIEWLLWDMVGFCNASNIPIEKHIQAKHEFNKTREHLHGKQY